jgi:hypothetical protein
VTPATLALALITGIVGSAEIENSAPPSLALGVLAGGSMLMLAPFPGAAEVPAAGVAAPALAPVIP